MTPARPRGPTVVVFKGLQRDRLQPFSPLKGVLVYKKIGRDSCGVGGAGNKTGGIIWRVGYVCVGVRLGSPLEEKIERCEQPFHQGE